MKPSLSRLVCRAECFCCLARKFFSCKDCQDRQDYYSSSRRQLGPCAACARGNWGQLATACAGQQPSRWAPDRYLGQLLLANWSGQRQAGARRCPAMPWRDMYTS